MSSVQSIRTLFVHPCFVNSISFFFLSLVAFRENLPYLFYAYDGQFEVSLITTQSLFAPINAGLAGDFIHGLGNVEFAFKPSLFLEYLLPLSRPGDFSNFPLCYDISATELFLITFLLGRVVGVPRLTALAAAWLLPLLTFQYVGFHLIANTFRFFPHYGTAAALSCAISVAILFIGTAQLRGALLAGAIALLITTYLVVAAPTLLLLAYRNSQFSPACRSMRRGATIDCCHEPPYWASSP